MFVKIRAHLDAIPANRMLVIVMLLILAIAMIVGLAWMQMDHVMAPPGLRMMNWLWSVFV